MILLLDAHALLWTLSDADELERAARHAIDALTNDVLVSVASVWELEMKRASGRLRYEADLLDASVRAGFDVIPIIGSDALAAARLPPYHRDPFDRMLIAQAGRLGATVVSRDGAFDAYGVERLAA